MRRWAMALAVCAAVLAASASRAQTAALGDLRMASRVTTNEQDAAATALTLASNAAARAALAAHATGHGPTDGGGFAGGTDASATYGGGAVGAAANVSGGGGAVGGRAETSAGGAVGFESFANFGGAVGEQAVAVSGGAVGAQATTSDGFAGGMHARAELDGTPIDAIQLGTGTNPNLYTLQVYGHKLMDAEGRIPVERTPWVPGWGDVTNIVGWVVTTNNTVINNYWGGSVTEIYVIITNLAPYAAVTGIVEWGVSPIWTVIDGHTNWHSHTPQGGFWGGSNATATTGGAIGLWAAETAGGGAVGAHAASRQGGAVGELAASISGGAVGLGSVAEQGGAVGDHAATSSGGAVGMQATTSDGFAGGMAARAEADGMPIDAIQLGTGRNPDAKSLQVYDYKLMDADGKIPAERLTMPTNIVSGWLMYDYGSNMWLRVSVSNWSFTVWEVVE